MDGEGEGCRRGEGRGEGGAEGGREGEDGWVVKGVVLFWWTS